MKNDVCSFSIFGEKIEYGETAYSIVNDADALLVVTEWNEFMSPDLDLLKSEMKNPVIYDGRNIYDRKLLKQHGFEHYQIGRQ